MGFSGCESQTTLSKCSAPEGANRHFPIDKKRTREPITILFRRFLENLKLTYLRQSGQKGDGSVEIALWQCMLNSVCKCILSLIFRALALSFSHTTKISSAFRDGNKQKNKIIHVLYLMEEKVAFSTARFAKKSSGPGFENTVS